MVLVLRCGLTPSTFTGLGLRQWGLFRHYNLDLHENNHPCIHIHTARCEQLTRKGSLIQADLAVSVIVKEPPTICTNPHYTYKQ